MIIEEDRVVDNRGRSFHFSDDVTVFEDEEFLLVELDFLSSVLGKHDCVSDLDSHRYCLAIIVVDAWSCLEHYSVVEAFWLADDDS